MEKICIAKRRNKSIQEIGRGVTRALTNNFNIPRNKDYVLKELNEDKNHVLSFNLTPEQCEIIRPNSHIQSLLNGTSRALSLDMHQHNDGQIIFKFYFKKEKTVKLLKTKHVCQMLQISTSFLKRLVKEEKIKSLKLGRLRRFSLEYILEYLTENEKPGN